VENKSRNQKVALYKASNLEKLVVLFSSFVKFSSLSTVDLTLIAAAATAAMI
jgi:hypothetical protein